MSVKLEKTSSKRISFCLALATVSPNAGLDETDVAWGHIAGFLRVGKRALGPTEDKPETWKAASMFLSWIWLVGRLYALGFNQGTQLKAG